VHNALADACHCGSSLAARSVCCLLFHLKPSHHLLRLVAAQTDSNSSQSQSSTNSQTQTTSTSGSLSRNPFSHDHSAKSTSTTRGGIAPFKTKTTHSTHPTHPVSETDGFTDPFFPPPTHRPRPPNSTNNHSGSGPSGWVIMLEVVGSLLGLALLAALARCFWSYRKTPRHHHVRADSIQEIRRELLESRRPRSDIYHPPPPYRNPPSYEVAQCSQPGLTLISPALTPSALPSHIQQSPPLQPLQQQPSLPPRPASMSETGRPFTE
jgi:hypothetical protein